MRGIVWFRRDLRVHAHSVLDAALAEKVTELTQDGLWWLLLSIGKPPKGRKAGFSMYTQGRQALLFP